jgi:hypothetical protein
METSYAPYRIMAMANLCRNDEKKLFTKFQFIGYIAAANQNSRTDVITKLTVMLAGKH